MRATYYRQGALFIDKGLKWSNELESSKLFIEESLYECGERGI